jgi:glutathione synthase/RimK-type ligase-like ATP-grasp enzyme
MILLFGCGDDSCIEMTVTAARELGIPHRFVDQRTLGDDDALQLRIGSRSISAELTVGGEAIDLRACTAVYARALGVGATEGALRLTRTFNEWLDITDAYVVNRPFAMRSNGSKPFQAQLIARHGFRVPETLVTNEPVEVIDFARAHGRLIYKSVSGIRSIVRELDVAADLDRIRGLATQFQALIDGDDVRVHVVGDDVFATAVHTEAVDYRYAARDGREVEHHAVQLDAETAARCVALARALDLPLCGIDLRRTTSGDYVCFEVNPMPAFSYYQGLTGQPIARSVVSALAAA